MVPTFEGIPRNAYFDSMYNPVTFGYPNFFYLEAKAVLAKAAYATEFLRSALARLGSLDGLFGVLFENEAFFRNDVLPFSSRSIIISTGDGLQYNMADTASRQQCADANAV